MSKISKDNTPTYSVVVPVFNSGPELADLITKLTHVFEKVIKERFEILLVNDGSKRADTLILLKKMVSMPQVSVIYLTRNFGKAGAVLAGMSVAKGDWIVTIDDDLQQRPEDIPKLIAHRDHDMVTATHKKKKHAGPFRFISSGAKGLFDKYLLGFDKPISPLKLLRRPVVDGMLSIRTNRPFIPALIRQITDDVVSVETGHDKSAYTKSRYSFRRRWNQFSDLLIGNSGFMMRLFTWVGFVLAGLAFILALSILWRKLSGQNIQPGWASLMFTMLLVGGLNLVAIGISGQYFVRILDISSNKPAFTIRKIEGESF